MIKALYTKELSRHLETALPYRFRGPAGRYTYAYGERYFAEFNFGYNGSENFNPKKRYGFFPSFGLGWVVSNERFFEPLKHAVQFMKFRATWGKVGNAKITGRRFAYLSTMDSVTGYTFGDSQKVSYSGLAIGDEGVDGGGTMGGKSSWSAVYGRFRGFLSEVMAGGDGIVGGKSTWSAAYGRFRGFLSAEMVGCGGTMRGKST